MGIQLYSQSLLASGWGHPDRTLHESKIGERNRNLVSAFRSAKEMGQPFVDITLDGDTPGASLAVLSSILPIPSPFEKEAATAQPTIQSSDAVAASPSAPVLPDPSPEVPAQQSSQQAPPMAHTDALTAGTIAGSSAEVPPNHSATGSLNVGSRVKGLYPNGQWYAATVVSIGNHGTEFTLDWDDGIPLHRVQPLANVRALEREEGGVTAPSMQGPAIENVANATGSLNVGSRVKGLYPNGQWYAATVASIGNHGTEFTLDWDDGIPLHRVQPLANVRALEREEGGVTAPSMQGPYGVGTRVQALYCGVGGNWYDATVASVDAKGEELTLDWDDGIALCRQVPLANVRRRQAESKGQQDSLLSNDVFSAAPLHFNNVF